MSAAEKVLERLDHPKKSGPSQWMAGCPCCKSKEGRPLAVNEKDDGRVLLHAFCGCSTEQVLKALGLEMGDLFEKPLGHRFAPTVFKIPASQVLSALEHEANVLALIAADLAAGKPLDAEAQERLTKAAARISHAGAIAKATR